MRIHWILVAGLLCACAAPEVNTTELKTDDLQRMTDQMAVSLVKQNEITSRSSGSTKWVFSIDKVRNLTMHVMEPREQWMTMVRLRALLNASQAMKEKNIVWVLRPEEWARYAGDNARSDPMFRSTPTHLVRAEFRSDTNQSLKMRSDTYLCAFQLVRLNDGSLIWEDAYETKYLIEKNRFD